MKVHIHGNCQSYVMSMMLREVCPEWDVTYFEVHAEPIIKQNEDYRAAIRNADIILTQPINDGYRGRSDLSSEWVKNEAKPGCELIIIPAMHFEGHHPGYGGLALGDLCSSSIAAHLAAVGVPPAAAVDKLLSVDLFDEDFVRSEAGISLKEMVSREKNDRIDIPLSPAAEYFTGEVQLFHIVNHPTRPIYSFILTKILERLRPGRSQISATGTDYQSSPHIPMLPAVAFHRPSIKERPAEWRQAQDQEVRIPHYPPMSQRVYYERMIEQLVQHSTSTIQSTIRGNARAVALLRRLSKAKSDIPDLNLWEAA